MTPPAKSTCSAVSFPRCLRERVAIMRKVREFALLETPQASGATFHCVRWHFHPMRLWLEYKAHVQRTAGRTLSHAGRFDQAQSAILARWQAPPKGHAKSCPRQNESTEMELDFSTVSKRFSEGET